MAAAKNPDKTVNTIEEKLRAEYCGQHPQARVDVKRYNSVSVRIRVIDPDFATVSRTERDNVVWAILDSLPDKVRADITLLVLLTPSEAKTSIMNLEFEDPLPSRL